MEKTDQFPATDFFKKVSDTCLDNFQNKKAIDLFALSIEIMNIKDFPMHAPVHHYLVPAVLLTASRKSQGHGEEILKRDLEVALERAQQVPGGSCGFFGACGACVGCGIFISLITDSSPYSSRTWALSNQATSKALAAISDLGGPRCCKRCSWVSLLSARSLIEKELQLELLWTEPDEIRCSFHELNNECIRVKCPFYPLEVQIDD
ncbi:MAG: DUF5714 domain-containing protein [Eubacteriales bacterium]|nr:DUF5714 domain-containing protein [Eubacteriales bacterium]